MFGLDNFFQLGGQLSAQMFAEEQQHDQQLYNTGEAKITREWQEAMRGTAYQTAVKDMEKAGLSPMLAYSHGPTQTPQGAQASSGTAGAGGHAQSNFSAAALAMSQYDVNKATEQNIHADTERKTAETKEITARTETYPVNIDRMRQEIEQSKEQIRLIGAQTVQQGASAGYLQQHTRNLEEAIPQIRATVRNLDALTKLHGAQEDQARASAGLSREQMAEIKQRVAAQLPQLEAALRELERAKNERDVPRQEQDRAAHDRFTGAIGALIRSLTGIGTYFK